MRISQDETSTVHTDQLRFARAPEHPCGARRNADARGVRPRGECLSGGAQKGGTAASRDDRSLMALKYRLMPCRNDRPGSGLPVSVGLGPPIPKPFPPPERGKSTPPKHPQCRRVLFSLSEPRTLPCARAPFLDATGSGTGGVYASESISCPSGP